MSSLENLKNFGLDDKKARVYIAALELGTAKANEIAKKANIERPTTYDILNKLNQEGLVGTYKKKGVLYYIAANPEILKHHLEEKQLALDQLLPELKSVYNTLKAKPKISYFEGIEGVKTVLDNTLTAKDKILRGILSMDDLFKIPGKKFMDGYVSQRVQLGYMLHVIRSKPKDTAETWATSTAEHRELRYSPSPMVFAMTTYIYDNKVALISSKKENFGMIIESDEFHQTMNHMFEALWQMSEKV